MNHDPLQVIKETDLSLFTEIKNMQELAYTDGEISKKHKLLIALAIDAAKQQSRDSRRSLTSIQTVQGHHPVWSGHARSSYDVLAFLAFRVKRFTTPRTYCIIRANFGATIWAE